MGAMQSRADAGRNTVRAPLGFRQSPGCHTLRGHRVTEALCASPSAATARVRCCSCWDDPGAVRTPQHPSESNNCSRSNPKIAHCSKFCSTPNISRNVTQRQARRVCSRLGQRLCSHAELLADICCLRGGGADHAAVWTATPCSTVGSSLPLHTAHAVRTAVAEAWARAPSLMPPDKGQANAVAVAAALCRAPEDVEKYRKAFASNHLQARRAAALGVSLAHIARGMPRVLLASRLNVTTASPGLREAWDRVVMVEHHKLRAPPGWEGHLRPEGDCYTTKFAAWGLVEYRAVVLVDTDVCVLEDPRPWALAALAAGHHYLAELPSPGLNSHFVFVRTNVSVMHRLRRMAARGNYEVLGHVPPRRAYRHRAVRRTSRLPAYIRQASYGTR